MVDQSLIDQINMGEAREHAEGDEFVLDGRPIPAASMQATGTGRFEGKVTFGDYTKDSDNLMSSWILSNWSGGTLINNHIEGATDNRFKWAEAWTMSADQLALPPKVETFRRGDAFEYDYPHQAWDIVSPLIEAFGGIYFHFGEELWRLTGDRYTLTNLVWDKIGSIGERPYQAAMVNDDTFVVSTLSGAYFVTRTGTITADPSVFISFVLAWDRKVFAMDTEGYLRIYTPDDGLWSPQNPDLRVGLDEEVRGITEFYDRAGDPTLAVATDSRIYLYDASGAVLHPLTTGFPYDYNNGMGFAAWRDDALYYSTGYGVTRITRDGVKTDMGLDRDDGLPDHVVGGMWRNGNMRDARTHAILSLQPAYNFLVASVSMGATTVLVDGVETYQVRSKIMAWNEAGWHCLADTDTVSYPDVPYVLAAGNMLTTNAVGGYRLWWGTLVQRTDDPPYGPGNPITIPMEALTVSTIEMPRAFHGPRQKVLSTIGAFAPDGVLYTGWFDSGMRGFYKTWSHLELYLTDPGDGEEVGGYVDVSYRTSESDEWTLLGTADRYGQNVLPFGVDADGFERGETSRQIEFRLDLHTDIETRSPIVNSLILKYIKLPLEGTAWLANIELDSENMKNLGPREIYEYLSSLTSEGGFSKMIHHRAGYRVRAAQVQAVEGMADNPFMRATVNLIEVPINRDEDM